MPAVLVTEVNVTQNSPFSSLAVVVIVVVSIHFQRLTPMMSRSIQTSGGYACLRRLWQQFFVFSPCGVLLLLLRSYYIVT